MADPDLLDALLRLGREIREAAQADEWARASELIDRRGELVQRLPPEDEDDSPLSREERKKLEALVAQNESLAGLFRDRQDEIGDKLEQVSELRRAQSSYQEGNSRSEALHNDLTG